MRERITFDANLKQLIEEQPKIKELLYDYGLKKLEEEDIADVVLDKLTLKGFFRMMDLDDETQGLIWEKIQHLYKEMEDKK
ncbi:DUF1858 domain-containing protein [Hydrogenobacter hydrogenophilus]|uniref:DUF1858 domain-containing protein n=1 Tax=Hydrogenobacter hydrogenophilus TaxID=35835 RepID=A0A285P1W9_9AQUI|nr:DUF1858 domain-containing protein [Hydrogenobacter hydrogenophilus]SNZ15448.1 protein of unknown function [Hydrogenobacter hydrogenophilus]